MAEKTERPKEPMPSKDQRRRQMAAVLIPLYREWVKNGRPMRDKN